MDWVDRLGRWWRIRKAERYITLGATVLDVGCGDGALFRQLGARIGTGVGVDPNAPDSGGGSHTFVRDRFPTAHHLTGPFDVVTCLAMLEHVQIDEQPALAAELRRLVRPGGRVIVTVPSPLVDPIVDVLRFLHLGEGVACEQHYGFEPGQTRPLFEAAGFRTEVAKRFQLGLNNLFVFVAPV